MSFTKLPVEWCRELVLRVLGSLGRGRTDADIDEELRSHLELATEDARAKGERVETAVRAAVLRSGGLSSAMEAVRDQRGLSWLDDLWRDVRYGVRTLARAPGFTAVAVLTLALGTGAAAAVYQLFDAIRLRPLPVTDPQELVILQLADRSRWSGRRTTGYPALTNPLWEHVRDHQDVFDGVFAWSKEPLQLNPTNSVQPARGLFVSGGFFDVLGISPRIGRLLGPGDDIRGCGLPRAVLSHGYWTQLGSDPGVIGRLLRVNGHDVEIVGVAPRGFFGVEVGGAFDMALPVCAYERLGAEPGRLADGNTWWLTVMGRLRNGDSLQQADLRLAALSPQIFRATLPSTATGADAEHYLSFRLAALPGVAGVSALRDRFGDPLVFLLITTGLVLLVACANLAGLSLARAAARERELGTRLALGASRGRLFRQAMVEHALVALAGAAGGIVVARFFSLELIRSFGENVALETGINGQLIGLMLGMAGVACLLFGAAPAWRSARAAAAGPLLPQGRGVGGSVSASRARRVLVAVQLAVSLVLVVGAVVFATTLRNLLMVDPGFDTANVSVARIDFSALGLASGARLEFARNLLDRIRNLPGVEAAAAVRHVPFSGTGSSLEVLPSNGTAAPTFAVRQNAVDENWLELMKIDLRAGRNFMAAEVTTAAPVAIVNETFARRLGIEGNPVGTRFRAADDSPTGSVTYEIVGLVADTKYFSLREEFLPIVFVPLDVRRLPRPVLDVMIHSSAGTAVAAVGLQRAVDTLNPAIRTNVRSLETDVFNGLRRERLMAPLAGFFGVLAGLIAAIGLYGLLSYQVARRTKEIGVRLALGARRRSIAGMVLGESAILLVAGLTAGCLLSLAMAGSVRSLLFGVRFNAIEPMVIGCGTLAAVAFVATWIPARRALNVNPLESLRGD